MKLGRLTFHEYVNFDVYPDDSFSSILKLTFFQHLWYLLYNGRPSQNKTGFYLHEKSLF